MIQEFLDQVARRFRAWLDRLFWSKQTRQEIDDLDKGPL